MRTPIALLSTSLSLVLIACGGAAQPPAVPEPGLVATATATATAAPAVTAPPIKVTTPAPTTAACAGPIATPPPGLVKADEPAPAWSIGEPGKGSLCAGEVFIAKGPVTVYRLFSASWKDSKLAGPKGAFWTLDRPGGTAATYRNVYEICKEWNDLDMINECTIEAGARVVLGPGQSATCDKSDTSYPRSAANQVVLVKKADGSVPVVDCKEAAHKWAP
jgi:hypothetical protein